MQVAGTEVVAEFVARHNRSAPLLNCPKARIGYYRCADASVILLQPIIEVVVRPMLDIIPSRLAMARGYERCPSVVTWSGI